MLDSYGNRTEAILLSYANRVEFTQLTAAYKTVNLGQGFPDFAPPKFVQEAFCDALNGGPLMHQYTRAFVSGRTLFFHVCLSSFCNGMFKRHIYNCVL